VKELISLGAQWAFGFALDHLFLVAGIWFFFWGIGSTQRRHRWGATVLGVLATAGLLGFLWRRRADVTRGLTVIVVGGAVIIWGLLVWKVPGVRWRFVVPTTGVGLLILFFPGDLLWEGQHGGLVYEALGGRSIRDWFFDWIELGHVQHQVRGQLDDDSAVGRPRRLESGEVYVPLHLNGDPEQVNPYAIGGAINRTGQDVRSVTVIPGSRLGTGGLVISDAPPAPPVTPWECLAEIGTLAWPGPLSDDPAAPVRFGFYPDGRELRLPPPGLHGGNVLLAGETGAGKSSDLHVIVSDLCFRRDTALWLLDPDGVELGPYRDRATVVAQNRDTVIEAMEELVAIMEHRTAWMDAQDPPRRFWRVGIDGPQILVVFDEYAAIPEKYKDPLEQWLARARKVGGGTFIATQRPERKVIPLIQRDNCRVRIALAMNSAEAVSMTLGPDGYELAPDLLTLNLKGAGYARIVAPDGGGRATCEPHRAYLLTPPRVENDDPIGTAARIVAAHTKHLRITKSELLTPCA
jgi:hypothetical protein